MKLYFYDEELNDEIAMQIKNSDKDYWLSIIEGYNNYCEIEHGTHSLIFTRSEEIFVGRNR